MFMCVSEEKINRVLENFERKITKDYDNGDCLTMTDSVLLDMIGDIRAELLGENSTPKNNNITMFEKITDEMLELYIKKNADYGDSVHDTFKDFGLISFLVRMQDKLNRLKTLNKQEAVVEDEKIEDTLIDLSNYAILALIELKKGGLNDGK